MKTTKIVLTTLLVSMSSACYANASSEFTTLLDEHWEWQLAASPTMASQLGDRRYNDQWPDQNLQAIEQRHDDIREFLRRAYAIDRKDLSIDNQLNYELFRRQLEDTVDAYQFNNHLMPFSHRGGVQNLDNLTNSLRLTTVEDFEDWLARISKIDVVIEQTIALAEKGRKVRLHGAKDSDAAHSASALTAGRRNRYCKSVVHGIRKYAGFHFGCRS